MINQNYSRDAELLEFGSILVNTEATKEPGDIILGSENVTESDAPDLRIVAEAPDGLSRWYERKRDARAPWFEHFYYAVPISDPDAIPDSTGDSEPQFVSVTEKQNGVTVAALR